jgi:prepilin-type N-terminal cleavage/methylation domain-containing protein
MTQNCVRENNTRGFTLVELMVVVGIFAFISMLTLANYSQFNTQIVLENTAHEVALEVRQAQSFGLGVREALSTTGTYPGYGIYIPASNSTKVYLYADVDGDKKYEGGDCVPGTGECVEVLQLRNHSIYALCGDLKTDHASLAPFRLTSEVDVYADGGFPDGEYCNKDSIDIIFTRPNPDAFLKGYIGGSAEHPLTTGYNDIVIVVATPQGDARTIVVWSTGQITVE